MDELYTKSWIAFYDRYSSEKSYEQRATEAIAIIKTYNPDAKRLLELACGTGRYTKYLIRAGFSVMATDISKDAIVHAKQKALSATFDVMDMRDLNYNGGYDVVACFYESFRYMKSYADCKHTLSRIHNTLEPKGLFLCDFSHFPESRGVTHLAPKDVDMGDGLVIRQETTLFTDGDFDERKDKMSFIRNGVLEKVQDVKRDPLLRISEKHMAEMLVAAGFKIVEIRRGFAGYDESILFIAKRV
jgi:SAM-dependent methyltransferase